MSHAGCTNGMSCLRIWSTEKKNHRPNVCFWLKGLQMRSIMPPNKSGNCRWGLWTAVFCQIYLHTSIFCSSFQKCLLQHLMGKSEFKKGRATPSAKTQRQPTCFHMFPCTQIEKKSFWIWGRSLGRREGVQNSQSSQVHCYLWNSVEVLRY